MILQILDKVVEDELLMRGPVKLGSIPCPQLEWDITKKMGLSLLIKILEKQKLINFRK